MKMSIIQLLCPRKKTNYGNESLKAQNCSDTYDMMCQLLKTKRQVWASEHIGVIAIRHSLLHEQGDLLYTQI